MIDIELPASDKVRLGFTGAEHVSEILLMDMLGNVIAGDRSLLARGQ